MLTVAVINIPDVNCPIDLTDDVGYLLCASGEERLVAVTASSEHNYKHRANRSCLDSTKNGDNQDGVGRIYLFFFFL